MTSRVLTFVLLALLTGCGTTPQKMDNKMIEKITYLALGDSYTIGESVAPGERWPVQLSDALNTAGYPAYSPLIVAQTGWTTDELLAALDQSNIEPPFDLVSLLIGVNNQYRGRDVENFRTEFNQLLDRAIAFAGDDPAGVLVVSIPDWGVTPFAEGRDREKIAAEIDAYNQVKQEETEKRGVLFINITDISRQAGSDSTLLAGDGLHPSGKMYGSWVERILPKVTEKLEQ